MCFFFQIEDTDQLPKNICVTCLEKLCEIHAFRLEILRADTELRRVEDLRRFKELNDVNTLHSVDGQSDTVEMRCAEEARKQLPLTNHQIKGKNKTASEISSHCTICDKYFVCSYRLEQHLVRKHTVRNDLNVLKPFECDLCDKAYTTMANLNIHKQTHSGELHDKIQARSQIRSEI